MRFSVHHLTRFEFDQPSRHSIHDVRLKPMPASGQRVLTWRIEGPGKRSDWTDGHGNQVTTFSVAQAHSAVEIEVHGVYDYSGDDQWLRYADTPTLPAPFWLRNTGMARHDASLDPLIDGLAERAGEPAERVAVLHEVMKRVGERVAYRTGVSTVETTAIEALARGRRRGAGHRARLHRGLPPARRAGALCQRLPAQRRP
jgi:transglutaminase-like putative cysteine protease